MEGEQGGDAGRVVPRARFYLDAGFCLLNLGNKPKHLIDASFW